jgi:hypothetical protein
MAYRVGFGTIAPNTAQNWFFSFGGNGDVRAQWLLPHPLNPSGRLCTTEVQKELGGDGHYTYFANILNRGPLTVSFNWDGGGVT